MAPTGIILTRHRKIVDSRIINLTFGYIGQLKVKQMERSKIHLIRHTQID